MPDSTESKSAKSPESSRKPTRARVLDAATATLVEHGFARSTARAIARTGGFAPGVIYYHFDSLEDLFVATAQHASAIRLERYRAHTDGVRSAVELLDRLRLLYEEDQSSGHVAAVQELVAAAVSAPALAEQVRELTGAWQQLAEDLIRTQIQGQMFESLVPVRELAAIAVGAYLGLEMLSHLAAGPATPQALFDAALPAATMIDFLRG